MNVVLDTVFKQQESHLLQGDHVDVSGLMLPALTVYETSVFYVTSTVYKTSVFLCYWH
jgi:hypothetical protein